MWSDSVADNGIPTTGGRTEGEQWVDLGLGSDAIQLSSLGFISELSASLIPYFAPFTVLDCGMMLLADLSASRRLCFMFV